MFYTEYILLLWFAGILCMSVCACIVCVSFHVLNKLLVYSNFSIELSLSLILYHFLELTTTTKIKQFYCTTCTSCTTQLYCTTCFYKLLV
jgi:hypothetical protein